MNLMNLNLLKKTAAFLLVTSAMAATAQTTTPPENLYLIGDATTAGWNANEPVTMEKVSDYEFTYTGDLNIGEFKMPWVKGDGMWGGSTYIATTAGEPLTAKGLTDYECAFTPDGSPDSKWRVKIPGTYKLTLKIDPTDISKAKLTAECISTQDYIYALGQAFSQYDSFHGTPIEKKENGVYVCQCSMIDSNENRQIKFTLSQGNWDAVYFIQPTDVDYYFGDNQLGGDGSVQLIEPGKAYPFRLSSAFDWNGSFDQFWGVQQDMSGKYEVTVDLIKETVTFNFLQNYDFDQDNVTELHILGLSSGCFDSKSPGQMTSLGDGKFTWTGNLAYNTDDGDPDHKNKQFKFVTPTGEWNEVFYLVPADANTNGITEIEVGTHYLKMVNDIRYHNLVDAFFGLEPDANGNYTINVDVPSMTVELKKNTSGIEEIEAAQTEGEEQIFDLNGRPVNRENACAGFYIIRKGGNVTKAIIK